MGMARLKKTSQSIEAINHGKRENEPEVSLRQYHRRRSSGPRFEERHQRVTTYLENDLFRQIESLRERGKILNLTALFNQALHSYLKEHYEK